MFYPYRDVSSSTRRRPPDPCSSSGTEIDRLADFHSYGGAAELAIPTIQDLVCSSGRGIKPVDCKTQGADLRRAGKTIADGCKTLQLRYGQQIAV